MPTGSAVCVDKCPTETNFDKYVNSASASAWVLCVSVCVHVTLMVFVRRFPLVYRFICTYDLEDVRPY